MWASLGLNCMASSGKCGLLGVKLYGFFRESELLGAKLYGFFIGSMWASWS